MKTKRFYLLLVVVFATMFLVACGAPAAAPTATPIPPTAVPPTDTPNPPTATPVPPTATPTPIPIPERILFIGDSFTFWNEGIEKHVKGMAASCDPPLQIETARVVLSGAPLIDIWQDTEAPATIRDGNWDTVVLQEDLSWKYYDQGRFNEYVRKFDEEIKRKGARTVLYMAQDYKSDYYKTSVEDIANAYGAIGSELGIDVAPVALAWESASNSRPDLNLYYRDEIHPNILGTYLTANVLHNVLFKQSSEGCTYLPIDLLAEGIEVEDKEKWEISEVEASFLQSLAWETVKEYENK